MISVGSGLVAAVANASQAVINKQLTTRYPARQLIGALYLCNFLVLLPLAPFAEWRWSAEIVALHLLSVALMAVTALSASGTCSRRALPRPPPPPRP